MRARIHRGADQIGGSCVELVSSGRRLVLDLGRPLSAAEHDDVPLPPIPGLADGEPPEVVLLSHPHRDHWGLVPQLGPDVPVVLGEAGWRVLEAASFFGPEALGRRPARFLEDRRRLDFGPFAVTPFAVDHSAFDAFALLVEAEGRRLLYTGDLRGHGRKAALFERMLRRPPQGVHALLMEGTSVRACCGPHDSGSVPEDDLVAPLAQTLRGTDGLALVAFSGQNIDRLVTVYKACRRAGRQLVIDLYGQAVAAATGRRTIPKAGFPELRVWLQQRQRVRVKRAGAFGMLELKGSRVYLEEIAREPGRFALMFRSSMLAELEAAVDLAGSALVWSQWAGYLARDARLQEFLGRSGLPVVHHHTSGHADVPALQRLVAAVAPERVVPIHTEAPERFRELFERVELRADGEWWTV